MVKILNIFFISVFFCHYGYSQIFDLPNNSDEQQNIPKPVISNNQTPNFIYKNEFSGQLMMTSRGVGINFRRAQNSTIERKRLFEFDWVYVNHPKELKIMARNNDYRPAKNYKYGKINSCFFLRAGVGFQNRLYRRGDRKSVEIRYNTNFGLSAAFLKPIYVYLYPTNNDNPTNPPPLVLHDPSLQGTIAQTAPGDRTIIGRATYFQGANKMKIVPGAYAKFSGMIEYGKNPQELKAIEIGVIADGFLRPLDIMKFYNKEQIVVSLYVSIVFGKKWF
jgi:hypothetical protein